MTAAFWVCEPARRVSVTNCGIWRPGGSCQSRGTFLQSAQVDQKGTGPNGKPTARCEQRDGEEVDHAVAGRAAAAHQSEGCLHPIQGPGRMCRLASSEPQPEDQIQLPEMGRDRDEASR